MSKDVICLLGVLAGGFISGILVGHGLRTKQIDKKISTLRTLCDIIKERNNKLVENVARVYQSSPNYDPSKITDVDAALMSMWID